MAKHANSLLSIFIDREIAMIKFEGRSFELSMGSKVIDIGKKTR